MDAALDGGCRPIGRVGLSIAAALRQHTFIVVATPLILTQCRQPRLLLVVEQTIEMIERRLNGLHRRDHRLEPRLHRRQTGGRGRRDVFRTGHLDDLRGLDRRIAEIVERLALLVIGVERLLDPVDRKPCDVLAVIAAHLRQFTRLVRRRIGSRRRRVARRQITGQVVIAVRCEHAGIDIAVAVIPQRGIVAPHRVVREIVKGERPEQRTNPTIAAVAMTPPAAVTAMTAPSGSCRCGGDMRAGRGIVQGVVVMQRAGHGTRRERMMNGVGAEICRAVVLTRQISCSVMIRNGAIAAETAAAGRARE